MCSATRRRGTDRAEAREEIEVERVSSCCSGDHRWRKRVVQLAAEVLSPASCPDRSIDLKGLINKFMERSWCLRRSDSATRERTPPVNRDSLCAFHISR